MPASLALIITYIIWGAAPPIFKFSLQGIPPFTLAFIRFFFGGIIFLPFAWKHWQKVSPLQMRDIVLGAIYGITVNVAFFFLGLQYSQSINVHIIGSLGPLFLYFLSIFMLNEKPHPQIVKGMIISVLGICIIVLMPVIVQKETTNMSNKNLAFEIIGNIFFIISTLGSVLHVIHNKRVLKKVNSYVVTVIGFFVSSVTFFPFMLYELSHGHLQSFGWNAWVGVIYGVVFSSTIGYFLFSYGMAKITAQEAAVYNYISPIVAVIVAIPLVHEHPSIYFVIGACLVFIGILISERHPHYHAVPKKLHKKL